MLEELKETPIWFQNRIKKVMEHNEYDEDMVCVDVCESRRSWTPVDLIIREYLNNGAGSAQGFLGITSAQCIECYNYIKDNKQYFIDNNLVNKEGWNNHNFTLWEDYGF